MSGLCSWFVEGEEGGTQGGGGVDTKRAGGDRETDREERETDRQTETERGKRVDCFSIAEGAGIKVKGRRRRPEAVPTKH